MINTNIFKPILFLALSLSLGFVQEGSAQTVNEYAPDDSLRVGDTFDFSITLNRDQDYDQILFPDTSSFTSNFEIRSQSQFKVSSFKDSVHYELQFFGTVDTTLPELPVLLVQDQDTTVLYTNPVPIAFHSVLAEDEEEFRPLKPIYEFALAWWPYILAFILLCIAAYYLYQYLTKKEEETPTTEPKTFIPTPFTNPLKRLQQSIAQLQNTELATPEDFKAFYIDLGDSIRRYFEDLHNIPALESTSREIIQNLKTRSIDKDLVDKTRSVLQEADMVKFAKFTPTIEQAERALQKAEIFLNRAKEIDGPRVEHLRRKHQAKIEEMRERFEQEQNAEKVDV